MKCDKCGKNFEAGSRPNRTPNGVGFELKDGTTIRMCSECLMSIPAENGEKWLDKFAKERR